MPALINFGSVFGPTPHILEIASGAKMPRVSSAEIMVNPFGLRKSLAILATNFDVATPTLTVNFNSSYTRARIDFAIVGPLPKSNCEPETSTNASSTLMASTSGDWSRKIFIKCRLISLYRSKRGARTAACGHFANANAMGIAL